MSLPIDSSYRRRKLWLQQAVFALFRVLSYAVVAVLFLILGFILFHGAGVIDWTFLTEAPTDGMTSGGIWPAIVGTFWLMVGSALFAFPVGLISGIYMSEYAPDGRLVAFIRTMTNNLAGIPSIVFGLFGMAFFVNYLSFGDSILAGSLTLGLLALPVVIRTTEDAFRDIAPSYREGSLALGATKAQAIWRVLLPMAMPRVITGLILSLGRVSALPYHLYVVATSGTDIEAQMPIAYGTAFVLIVIVLAMNLLANAVRKHFEKKLKSK